MNNKYIKGAAATLAVSGAASAAIFSPDILESLIKNLSEAGQTQFARDCFIFSLAAMIHASRMKKEIRANFESLTVSIDKVAEAFKEDLEAQRAISASHGEKLDNLAIRVASLENKQNNSKEN